MSNAIAAGAILASTYVPGSGGKQYLIYRPAGTQVEVSGTDCEYVVKDDQWVIQWEGGVTFDSGYAASTFSSEEEAWSVWNEEYAGDE